MKTRPGPRKVNYAELVKINMPLLTPARAHRKQCCKRDEPIRTRVLRKKVLDNTLPWSIIIFTYAAARDHVADAGERSQTRSLAGTRNFKPPAPRRDRPIICRRRFLRSQRIVQVKYEMLRRVQSEGHSGDGCRDGFRLLATLVLSSSVGLRGGWACRIGSAQRGPKQAHKLTDEVLDFIIETRQKQPHVRTAELVRLIQERFGTKVHPRSIERSLVGPQNSVGYSGLAITSIVGDQAAAMMNGREIGRSVRS